MKINVYVEVEDNCIKCPHVEEKRTPNAGYAFDYYCKKKKLKSGNKKIMGYVEYLSEIKPIPDWCPYIENIIN